MPDWSAVMDFGVVHPLIYFECRAGGGPIMETLPTIINDSDFGAIEIAPINDPTVRQQARDLLASSALQVVYLPILPIIIEDLGLGSADADKRAAAQTRLRALIDEAVDFDSSLAMITGPRDPGADQREAVTARMVEDLRQLCDYAADQSKDRLLHLTFENFDRDIEKKRLIGPTTEAVALVEAVDRPNLGLTIDLSHLPLIDETSAHALQTAGKHLIHAHIGNCVVDYPDSPLYGDFHPRFGHPLGRNDLPEVIEYVGQLNALNYWERTRERLGSTPILTMELKPGPGENPEAVLANGKRTFARAWANVHAG